MLIYWHDLRDFPYSEEEAAVGQKLIKMYYDFATTSKVFYDGVKVDVVKSSDMKLLEITKDGSGSMVKYDESFGNVAFWDGIESYLRAKEIHTPDEL